MRVNSSRYSFLTGLFLVVIMSLCVVLSANSSTTGYVNVENTIECVTCHVSENKSGEEVILSSKDPTKSLLGLTGNINKQLNKQLRKSLNTEELYYTETVYSVPWLGLTINQLV